MKYIIFFLFVFYSATSIVKAQGAKDQLSTTNKKAIKLYEGGLGFYSARDYVRAQEAFERAIEKDEKFIEPYILLGYIFYDKKQYEKSIEQYVKTFSINPDFYPNNYLEASGIEIKLARYDDAKKHLLKLLSYPFITPDIKDKANLQLKNCDFAIEAMKHPVPFNPINLGENINSIFDEYFPSITADDQTILFTRKIKDAQNPFGEQEDFYTATKLDNKWTMSYNMGAPINTFHNEGAPTLSADGQLLIFAASEEMDGYGANRTGYGSADLFFSKRIGNKWSAPQNLGPPINTRNWETQPSFSSDGKTLYFIRGLNTKGGVKDIDIYMSQITDKGWTTPVKLSKKINTPGNEESVFIHPDNQTLYFASDGHLGMGGMDLYMSKRQEDGEWGQAINLGYPINTSGDENSLLVGPSGDVGYFASDRKGGLGGLDLYSFELYKELMPEKITYVKGKVVDSKSKKALNASFELIDLQTAKTVVESESNIGNGEFLLTLPVNKDYALNVSKAGYVFYSENFSLKGIKDVTKPFMLTIPLQPIDTGVTVELKNIFFETGKYDLKEESKVELQKLVSFLNANKMIKIEVSGHTDNVGDKKSNLLLSQNRAKAVYDYIVGNSIATDRIVYKGYGDSKPKAPNDTPENKAKNRRTEFKIIAK